MNTNQATTYTLNSTSKMLNTYFNETLSPGVWEFGLSHFCCVKTPSGPDVIFSIGDNNILYLIFPDPQSDSGYKAIAGPLGIQYACVASGPSPNQAYAARASDGAIYLMTFDPQTERIALEELFDASPFVPDTIVHHRFQQEDILVLTNKDRGEMYTTAWYLLNVNQKQIYTVQNLLPNCLKALVVGSEKLPFPQALFVQSSPQITGSESLTCHWGTGIQDRSITTITVSIPDFENYLDRVVNFDVVQDSQGMYHIVVTLQNSFHGPVKVYTLSQVSGGTGPEDPPVFAEQWEEVTVKLDAGNQPVMLISPKACFTNRDELQIVVASDRYTYKQGPYQLFHAVRSKEHKWSDLMDTGINCQDFRILTSQDQQLEIYTFRQQEHFTRYWEDCSEIHLWNDEVLDISTEETVVNRNAYYSMVTVTDDKGDFVPNARVQIYSKVACMLWFNGEELNLEPNQPITVQSNLLGQVNLYQRILQNIAVPSLYIQFENSDLPAYELRAEKDVHTYLLGITDEELKTASDPQGQAVIPQDKQEHIPSVRASIQAAMNQISQYYDPNATPMTELPAWSILWNDGKWEFKHLSKAESQKHFESAQSPSPVAQQAMQELGLFGGGFDSIGSAFESVWNKTTEFVGVIWDGANVVAKFVYNGISIELTQALKAAETVLEFAYSVVKAILNALGTVLGVILGWLLKILGFLFGWQDILKNRDMLKEMAANWLQALPSRINLSNAQTMFENTLNNIFQNFDSWVANVDSKLGDISFYSERPSGSQNLEAVFAFQNNSLWSQSMSFVSRIFDYLSASLFHAPNFDPALLQAVQSLGQEIQSLIMAPLTEINATLTSWFENIEEIASQGAPYILNGLKDVMKHIVGLFGQLVGKVVAVLIQSFEQLPSLLEWFDKELDIPFFSTFYKYILQSKLSFYDLLALFVAVPLTLAEKLRAEELGHPMELELGDPFFYEYASIFSMAFAYLFKAMGDAADISQQRDLGKVLNFMHHIMLVFSAVGAGAFDSDNPEKHYWIAEGIAMLVSLLFLGVEQMGAETESLEIDRSTQRNATLAGIGLIRAIMGLFELCKEYDEKSIMLYTSGLLGVLRAAKLIDWPNRNKATRNMGLVSGLMGTIITVCHGLILKNKEFLYEPNMQTETV
ncbi:MAG: hypothetical protein IV090_22450 [Candidatus Sericytochromatia bacterium]|nr:hypothetical protein [Candidatus Sericytochromatia bacterium]